MRSRRLAFLATKWAFVVIGALFALAACQGNLASEPSSTPPPSLSPIPIGYAGNPVAANSQWTPVIQQFDGVEMVLVPAGCYMMGSTDEQLKAAAETTGQELDWIKGLAEGEQPANKVCFDQPFWIDRLEVTNFQFTRFGGIAEKESEWTGDRRPRETISQKEAQDFCEKRGARLPTEAEWEYAARGPDDLLFPWGNGFVADNAIYLNNSGRRTWNAGARPEGVSWVGALDMAGNVEEWTSSANEPYPYSLDHEKGVEDFTGVRGVTRGGAWYSNNYELRTSVRNGLIFVDAVGFRCARSTTDPQADMLAAATTPTATITPTPNLPVEETDLLEQNPLPSSYNGPLPEGVVAQLGLGELSVSSVSPDGKYVALGAGSSVLVYQIDTLELVWSFPSSHTSHIAWTHDGARLAADSWYDIIVYEMSSGHILLKLSGDHTFSDFAWTPDDRFLVSATWYRSGIDIWDGTTGQKLRTLTYEETSPPSRALGIGDMVFALSPDGKKLATTYTYSSEAALRLPGHTVVVWDIATGTRISIVDETEIDPDDVMAGLFDFAWSPDSKILAVNVNTGTAFSGIEFRDPLTGEKRGEFECCGYRNTLSWSPDGEKLLVYAGMGSEVVDTTTYQSLFHFDPDYDGELLGWSADSSQFAIHNLDDDSVIFMDSGTGEVQLHPSGQAISSTFTPDFTRFFFLGNVRTYSTENKPYASLVEWNAITGSVDKVLATGLGRYITGISWSPDGSRVAFSAETEHRQVVIWDVKVNEAVASLDSGSGSYLTRWSPNGKMFANVYNGIIDLYDASTWTLIDTISVNLSRMDWSPDSRRIAVQAEDAQLTVIDVPDGRNVFQKETSDRYSIVAWSSDGRQIATVGVGGHVEVWDADTGERLSTVSGLSVEDTYILSFSPDLSMLASAGDCQQYGCNSVNIWSTASGQLLHKFIGASTDYSIYTDTLWSPWFPDGSGLALYINKSVGLYNPQTGKLLKTLPALPDAFSPDGRLFATYDYTVVLWAVPN